MPIALDIGSEYLKIVEASVKKDSVRVKKAEGIKLPSKFMSLPENERTDIIKSLIKPVLSKEKFKGGCHITISDNRFLIRYVQLPKGSLSETRAMAFNEMALLYGAKEDDVIEISPVNEPEDNTQRVKCAVISKSSVNAYYNLVKSVNLKPVSLSFHSNGAEKFISSAESINNCQVKGKSFILLDMGMSSCIAHLCINGKYNLSRYTQLGFSQLNNMDKLTFLRKLSGEIAQIIISYRIYGSEFILNDIYIYGGGAFISGMDKSLSEQLNVNVSVIAEVSGVSADSPLDIACYLNGIFALL